MTGYDWARAHLTRTVAQPAIDGSTSSIAVCSYCPWHSGQYRSDNVARAVGERHEREAVAS